MLKVLLLDDDRHNLFMNAKLLRRLNCQVTESQTVYDVLSLLNSGCQYDVIFAEVGVSAGEGLSFLKQVKAICPHTCFVFTSIIADREFTPLQNAADYCLVDYRTIEDFAKVLDVLFPDDGHRLVS